MDAVYVPIADILIMLHVEVLETMDVDVDEDVEANVGVDEIVLIKRCGEDEPGVDDLIRLDDDGDVVGDGMLDVIGIADGADEGGCGEADDREVLEADTSDCDDDDDTLGLSKLADGIVLEERVERSCGGAYDVLAVTGDVMAAWNFDVDVEVPGTVAGVLVAADDIADLEDGLLLVPLLDGEAGVGDNMLLVDKNEALPALFGRMTLAGWGTALLDLGCMGMLRDVEDGSRR
jgi:hypothetical protein